MAAAAPASSSSGAPTTAPGNLASAPPPPPAAAAAAPGAPLQPPIPNPAAAAVSNASLYVGDLDESVNESQLFEMFVQIGQITSIRVCRDAVTRRSLGYAYVNYQNTGDAIRALEALNYTPINGKAIRIMWSHRDPSTRKSGVGNIFIKNLHEGIDNKALHDTFIAFGPILSCKIAQDDGKSKGYGFVHFETDEAANLAIEKVNGMQLEGKKVFVGKFVKRGDRLQDGGGKFTNVYVKNIDQELSDDDLRQQFSAFGTITNLVVMKDENNKSKGFGFVNFDTVEAAKAAVDNLNGAQIGTKMIYVGRAQKKAEREQLLRRQFEEKKLEQIQKYQGANLYVKNLDDSMDDELLRQEFSQFGNITSAKVMRDEKGVSKGFGFVCFSSSEEATRAANETNGIMLRGKPIYVALAQRKEARQAQLQQQYAQRMTGLMPPPGTPVAAAYPPLYYAAPPPALLQQRQGGLMYQPVMRPGWRTGPMVPPARPALQPIPPYNLVANAQRQQQPQPRPIRNRPIQSPTGQPLAQLPQLQLPQQQAQPGYKENVRNQPQQRPRPAVKYVSNGRPRDGAGAPSTGPVLLSPNMDVLSMMSAATPQQQKQLLGERLFPLVQTHQFELAGKITGMLLEMDNAELLVLLETPEALAMKVDEAVQVLQQHGKVLNEVPVA